MTGILHSQQSQELQVIFFDVGQGDAILIQQGSRQILIDGGQNGQKMMEKLGEYVPFWDRDIEVIIATHPDQDHISGLIDIMENYRVGLAIDNGVESDSQTYKKYKKTIEEKNIRREEGRAGMSIRVGDDVQMKILNPDGTQEKNNPKDTNESSIVAKLETGENSFLFTGDFTTKAEIALLKGPEIDFKNRTAVAGADNSERITNWKARVLKVGHHGSKYSTSETLLDAVKPEEAIISVGRNNRYGHPAEDIIKRLDSRRIKVIRTDEIGDVEYDL